MDTTMKPGLKTTEFWLSLAAAVLVGVAGIYSDREWAQVAGVLGTALIAMGYSAARGAAKAAAPKEATAIRVAQIKPSQGETTE